MNYTGSNPPNNPKIKAVAVIPARYDSVRLPGKALLEIAGKPMICWVAQRALAASNVSRVIVATDDERIMKAVESSGLEAVMTNEAHASGTDRIAEVASSLDADIIVNVQGDEPLISSETIERAVSVLAEDLQSDAPEIGIVTTWEPIDSPEDVLSPDVVKVVVNESEVALYFSRSAIPFPRNAIKLHGGLKEALARDPGLLRSFRKHTGLYVYRRDVLLEFASWPQTELERLECLEQLRALEHGVKIKAIKASTSSIGVDTMEDLERVRALVEEPEFQISSSTS